MAAEDEIPWIFRRSCTAEDVHSTGVTRVRVSLDEAYRLNVVEGLRVTVTLPDREPVDGLVVRVRREPPFAWVELTPLAPSATSRAG